MQTEVRGLRTIKDQNEIIAELLNSKSQNNVLGFFFRGQDELITTAVCDIQRDGEQILVRLRDYDLHGYPVPYNPVKLTDIASVIHFKTRYDDPFYLHIRQRKTPDAA